MRCHDLAFSRHLNHCLYIWDSPHWNKYLRHASVCLPANSSNHSSFLESTWYLPPQSCFQLWIQRVELHHPRLLFPPALAFQWLSANVLPLGSRNMQKCLVLQTNACTFSMYRNFGLGWIKFWYFKPQMVLYLFVVYFLLRTCVDTSLPPSLPPFCLDWQPFSLTQMVVPVWAPKRRQTKRECVSMCSIHDYQKTGPSHPSIGHPVIHPSLATI